MESDLPTPQDPARFSKPKSEPPILDLEAEKPENIPKPEAETASVEQKTLHPEKQQKLRLPLSGLIGGLIGSALTGLAVIGFMQWQKSDDTRLTDIQTYLTQKADQKDLAVMAGEIATIQSAIKDLKSALAAAMAQSPTPDTELLKRIDALETAIATSQGRDLTTTKPHHHDAQVALALAIRERIAHDRSVTRELVALEALGETGSSLASLKQNLTPPLASYASLIDQLSNLKIAQSESETKNKASNSEPSSGISGLFGRLVTVRSVDKNETEPLAPQSNWQPIIVALQDHDATQALALIYALPDRERTHIKSVESDLTRRVAAESASATLVNEVLDRLQKEGNP